MGSVKLTATLVGLWLTLPGASGGVLFTNLYSFTGNSDGGFPWGPLIQASDGNLYGTANYGGTQSSIFGDGTVYRLTLQGEFQQQYAFKDNGDGSHPFLSGFVEDADGFFYGTTVVGGSYQNGAVFVMAPDGFVFPIYSFSPFNHDGTGPRAGVTLGSDGNFYG